MGFAHVSMMGRLSNASVLDSFRDKESYVPIKYYSKVSIMFISVQSIPDFMDHDSEFPSELLPSNIFANKRSPILWVGSGISKRYVDGFKTWDELLSCIASKFGVNQDRYLAIKLSVAKGMDDPKPSSDKIAMCVASELSRILIDDIKNGNISASDILDEETLEQYRRGADPLKLLVCSGMGSLTFKQDMSNEIDCFKELRFSVPSVITTNYDTVLETLFNHEFKVFDEIDDYYGPDEMGIGEIYKIHGTIQSPQSIVLFKEDYDDFQDRAPIVVSKIVSLMCESPLLIMGYSMDDRIIRDTIGCMFSSFSRQKAIEISKNIVCIQYSKGVKPTRGIMQIESSNGTFHIQTIMIDDFLPVLKDISRYRMSFSVRQIRMLRQMMVEVSLSPDPNNSPRLAYAGIDGIDDVDPNRTVIALSTRTYLEASKSFISFSIDDLIKDVLTDNHLPAESVIDLWFEGNKLGADTHCPIFGYLYSLNRDPSNYSLKLSKYIEKKHEQYDKFFIKCSKDFSSVKDEASMNTKLGENKGFKRPDLVAYALHKGIIDQEKAKKMLFDEFKQNCKSDTYLKRAVTCLGYIRMFDVE